MASKPRATLPEMTDQDHKQALPPGFRLGSYRVVRVLGVGGFGITYLCEHAGLGVQVAVKEYLPNEIAVRDGTSVHPKSAGDREGFEWGLSRFLDEARTLARFEHPNVVRVRDCFEANSTAYIVMDYEDGESLDRLLQRLGTLTEAQLKRVVLPVAEGLREVHAAGFLHRDVKPSNIFVRRSDESPVLLDFGSARQALGRKSRSMTAIASAGYSPPEQYESHGSQGAWTDIYALCALCHRAITGEPPVEAPRRTGEIARGSADPQQPLVSAGIARYSSSVLEAVDWGLQLVESERPRTLDNWAARMAGSGSRTVRAEPSSSRHGGVLNEAIEAERGDATAQFNLAVQYRKGNGVAMDASRAALWYLKAADQGHAKSQNNLGVLYRNGDGVGKDACEAARWFRKAAEQGLAAAQWNLGLLYESGVGVPNDAGQAAAWYRRAAEQGHASAQVRLKSLHELPPSEVPVKGDPKDDREGGRQRKSTMHRRVSGTAGTSPVGGVSRIAGRIGLARAFWLFGFIGNAVFNTAGMLAEDSRRGVAAPTTPGATYGYTVADALADRLSGLADGLGAYRESLAVPPSQPGLVGLTQDAAWWIGHLLPAGFLPPTGAGHLGEGIFSLAMLYWLTVLVGIWLAARAYEGWRGWAALARTHVVVQAALLPTLFVWLLLGP